MRLRCEWTDTGIKHDPNPDQKWTSRVPSTLMAPLGRHRYGDLRHASMPMRVEQKLLFSDIWCDALEMYHTGWQVGPDRHFASYKIRGYSSQNTSYTALHNHRKNR